MAKDDDSPSASAHQAKKKRAETDNQSADVQNSIQLQRRRVWRACQSCRRKKIKCNGDEPTCSQCAASGSECTWLQTKDRAALSRHYVQELEARLLHMESLFTQIAPVIEQMGPTTANGGSLPGPSNTPAAPDLVAPAAAILRSIRPREQAPEPSSPVKLEDEMSDSFGQLALDEYGHMRWIGGSSTMSLIQSFRTITSSPLHRISPMEEDHLAPGPSVNKLYFPASVFFGKVHALPGPEEVEYPERDLADNLVNVYFARIHFLMPVIDKPSFMRQYEAVMDGVQDNRLARSQTAFISLVFAVFACAANILDDPRLKTERSDDGGMGMVYYERSLILQYISHANIQIAHVQCFTLLSSFLCSVNCLPQAWILLGQAVRTGQDLGLHRSPRRMLITPTEKETRRKVWWGLYSMDRMLALALGRPLGVNDLDCDVEYPAEVDDEHLAEYFSGANVEQRQPSLMTGFVALTKLYQIGGRVLREVYALDNCKEHIEPERKAELLRTVESLDAELTRWCDDLPALFRQHSETEEQVSMAAILCSHYYSILTTLHRNFLPVKRDQPVTPASTHKAVATARSCIRMAPSMKNAVPPSHHLAFFIQHLFSSAVILLLYAMHSSDQKAASSAMEEASSTLVALESWEGQWPGAIKCKELLLELSNTASQAIAKGERPPAPVSPPTTASPALLERRRSITIASPNAVPGRALKSKSRRTQSREAGGSSRRMAAVSPYRVDTARARSSSRRRGHEDGDGNEQSFYQSFSPTSARAPPSSASNHSSPAANVPSPPMTVNEHFQEASPTLSHANTFQYGSPGLTPAVPSPQRFEYDYSSFGQPAQQQQQQQWNGLSEGADIYHDSLGYGGYNGYSAGQDMMYSYDQDLSLAGLSTTPPTASFTGLPFRGLEYIRNYNSGSYSTGDDSIWQSYDPNAFQYNPEIPFTLGDPEILQDATAH